MDGLRSSGKVVNYVRNIDKDTMFRRLVEVVDAHQDRIEALEAELKKLREKKN